MHREAFIKDVLRQFLVPLGQFGKQMTVTGKNVRADATQAFYLQVVSACLVPVYPPHPSCSSLQSLLYFTSLAEIVRVAPHRML